MGWAQRANPTAQDKRAVRIKPKPTKASRVVIHSGATLVAEIMTLLFGLRLRPEKADAA